MPYYIRHMLKLCLIILSISFWACGGEKQTEILESPKPNVIYILADDMGYGDLSLLNPEAKFTTPNIDRLASQGVTFTDAHAPGSVCTPTRYGIVTGRYVWRSRLRRGVVRGYGPTVIEDDRTTLADLYNRNGYTTGCVGKWHLGVNWTLLDGSRPGENWEGPYRGEMELHEDSVDYTQPITGGPQGAGFDYSFILPASLDMKPYCYFENNVLVEAPTEFTEGNDLDRGFNGAFWRPGKIAPGFEFDQVLPTFIDKSIAFIQQEAEKETPFFLYLPLAAPHTPWVPTNDFKGESEAGAYGDFVTMVDAYVGKLLDALEETGQAENTLVVFTSDNGPYWRPDMIEKYNHRAAYIYKGMKADIWEGGHRVPFIARWPERIPSGIMRNDLMSLTDFMATSAAILEDELAPGEGEDSRNMLPALLDMDLESPIRESMIMQSSRGVLAVRSGLWKYIPHRGSGGFSDPHTYEPQPGEAEGQLYHLGDDPSESENVYLEHTDKVNELSELLEQLTALP